MTKLIIMLLMVLLNNSYASMIYHCENVESNETIVLDYLSENRIALDNRSYRYNEGESNSLTKVFEATNLKETRNMVIDLQSSNDESKISLRTFSKDTISGYLSIKADYECFLILFFE